jgi:hypothetical protein
VVQTLRASSLSAFSDSTFSGQLVSASWPQLFLDFPQAAGQRPALQTTAGQRPALQTTAGQRPALQMAAGQRPALLHGGGESKAGGGSRTPETGTMIHRPVVDRRYDGPPNLPGPEALHHGEAGRLVGLPPLPLACVAVENSSAVAATENSFQPASATGRERPPRSRTTKSRAFCLPSPLVPFRLLRSNPRTPKVSLRHGYLVYNA